MIRATMRRLVGAIATLGLLLALVFAATRLLPGDVSSVVLGEEASAQERAALRAELHLDAPVPVQFAHFARGILTLTWGRSLRRPDEACLPRVLDAARPTAALALTAVALGAVVGSGTAVVAVVRSSRAIRLVLDALAATPMLAFAPIVTWLFAFELRVVPLPGEPDAGLPGLLFAAGLLALPLAAHVGRLATALLEPLRDGNSLRLVRAKGASELRVWLAHGLAQVASTLVVLVGAQLGALLGGAVVLERLFERPGLGLLALEAWQARDLPMLEAAVLGSGVLFVGTQLAAATVASLVDARSRDA